MKAEVEAEKEKVSALKNKYSQQISAMEEEFEEIKTNVLRTAGRLDSLKSKLHADDEVNWNVLDDVAAAAVDFPASEIAVEETVDTEVHTETRPEAEEAKPDIKPEKKPGQPEAKEAAAPAEEVKPLAEPEKQDENVAEITLEELTAPLPENEAPEKQEAGQEKAQEAPEEEPFTLDDIKIDLPDLEEKQTPLTDTAEISFEGLEELFKEEEAKAK